MNAFLIFNIEYKFEIDNLDRIYFKLYKESDSQEKEKINEAYLVLKNPFLRICNLCEVLHLKVDINLEEIFKIIEEEKDIFKYSDNLLKEIFQFAKDNNLKQCATLLEKYKYLKKFHKH